MKSDSPAMLLGMGGISDDFLVLLLPLMPHWAAESCGIFLARVRRLGIISGRKTDRRVWAVTDEANFLACMLTTPTVREEEEEEDWRFRS